jgi:hypothetical protein
MTGTAGCDTIMLTCLSRRSWCIAARMHHIYPFGLKHVCVCGCSCRYIARAGRSAAANSWRTYVENYKFGFGLRLPYAQHAGRDVQTVTFKSSLLGW